MRAKRSLPKERTSYNQSGGEPNQIEQAEPQNKRQDRLSLISTSEDSCANERAKRSLLEASIAKQNKRTKQRAQSNANYRRNASKLANYKQRKVKQREQIS